MIQIKTMLNCIDNSGATIVECAGYSKMKRNAKIGDRIMVVVQRHKNYSSADATGPGVSTVGGKVKRGEVRQAVVVRTKKKYQRPDGMVVRFDDNACVLINKAGEPIGTRVNGVVGQELRKMKWSKILSMAPANV